MRNLLEGKLNDKRNPGVLIELHKQDVPYDLVRLINLGVITVDELEGFSEGA
ncbi:MAG: hypothetical protein IJZ34_04070 [Lachnospiraceae bacterium]|nr:hypothetical protein [Lachnospiraceae bacterium]